MTRTLNALTVPILFLVACSQPRNDEPGSGTPEKIAAVCQHYADGHAAYLANRAQCSVSPMDAIRLDRCVALATDAKCSSDQLDQLEAVAGCLASMPPCGGGNPVWAAETRLKDAFEDCHSSEWIWPDGPKNCGDPSLQEPEWSDCDEAFGFLYRICDM